jgi:hypothetical protein
MALSLTRRTDPENFLIRTERAAQSNRLLGLFA